MRYEELIEQSYQKINDKLSEIENTDDDDPDSLASLYDDLAETADKVATRFQKVSAAFNGEGDEDQQDSETKAEAEDAEDEPEKEKSSSGRKRSKVSA